MDKYRPTSLTEQSFLSFLSGPSVVQFHTTLSYVLQDLKVYQLLSQSSLVSHMDLVR